jgi:lysozyme
MTLLGIDVSANQGTVDWSAVRNAGVVFGVARAIRENGLVDNFFVRNWTEMKSSGIVRGAYIFFNAAKDAADQAQKFLSTVQVGENDLPPVLDIEKNEGVTGPALIESVQKWLDIVERETGRKPIIYTGLSFWNSNMNDQFGTYPLWIARYGVNNPEPLPKGWNSWTFWQYTESGSVAGIAGNVDMNHFNGTLDDLLAFVKGSGSGSIVTPQPALNIAPPSPAITLDPHLYTVQAGDTLGAIANRFNVSLQALVDLNQLANPNIIIVGQKLEIPPDA